MVKKLENTVEAGYICWAYRDNRAKYTHKNDSARFLYYYGIG